MNWKLTPSKEFPNTPITQGVASRHGQIRIMKEKFLQLWIINNSLFDEASKLFSSLKYYCCPREKLSFLLTSPIHEPYFLRWMSVLWECRQLKWQRYIFSVLITPHFQESQVGWLATLSTFLFVISWLVTNQF